MLLANVCKLMTRFPYERRLAEDIAVAYGHHAVGTGLPASGVG